MNAAPFWLTQARQLVNPLQWSRPAGKPPQSCSAAERAGKPAQSCSAAERAGIASLAMLIGAVHMDSGSQREGAESGAFRHGDLKLTVRWRQLHWHADSPLL